MFNTQPVSKAELNRYSTLFSDQWFYSTQIYFSNCAKNRLIGVCMNSSPNQKLVADLVKLGNELKYAHALSPRISEHTG